MESWIRSAGWLVCMAVAPWSAVSADGERPAPVVAIKPDRIILLDIDKSGERLVAVGERGFVLYSDDDGKTWTARPTPVTRTLTGVAFNLVCVAIGLAGSALLTGTLKTMLYEVSPIDPVVLGATCLAVLLVTTLASYVPARRALRVDPMVALRSD